MTRICSGGFLCKSGRYLFGLRSNNHYFYQDKWDIFGGHVEQNESEEEALVRELEEELGVTPKSYSLFGEFDEPNPEKYGEAKHFLFFITDWSGGEPQNTSTEHSQIRWFTRTELEQIDLASDEYLKLIDEWENKNMHINKGSFQP